MSSQGHTVRLSQLEIFAEETGKGSPTLVFIHYWGGSRRTWSEVVARLSKRFRCIALDVRGWGKSDRHADDYSLFAQADDVQGVIAALNVKDVVLVGHSMGGKIAQIVGGRRPEGLRAVVLVAPAPPTPLHVPDEQKQSMLASYASAEGIGEALKVISHRPLTIAQRQQVTEDSVGGVAAAKVAWISQGMTLDISKQAAAIAVPVCVIAGSADQVEKESALRAALLPLVPQARFETLEGVGHLSPLESPGELAEAIAEFVETKAERTPHDTK